MLKEGYNTSREWLLKVMFLTGAIPMFLMASLATISFLLAAFIVVTNGSWSDANQGRGLRVFSYAKGKRYLTRVGKEPDVEEVVNW